MTKAYAMEDFGALKQLSKDIKTLFEIGQKILQIKRELSVVLSREDFEAATELKKKLSSMRQTRDAIDALYETKRYERMIALEKPSAQHMAFVQQLMEEQRLEAERRRKEKEDEMEKHRKYLEELERRKQLEDMKKQREREPPHTVIRTTKTQQVVKVVENDPYDFNEGDRDLEAYLRPKLAQAGGKLTISEVEKLKWAQSKGILITCGVRLWSALQSDNWRHREAACLAFLQFLESPLIEKYQKDTRPLFRAAMEISLIACQDKLLLIYFLGLRMLITAMQPPIFNSKIGPKTVNKYFKPFIPILMEKIAELNYRARDVTMHTLISLFRHELLQIKPLVDNIMQICNPSEDSPEKQPWRLILSRLEVLLHLTQEFGVKQWDWRDVFQRLILPCFSHPNQDIRMTCVELACGLYQRLGQDLRKELDGNLKHIKPQLQTSLFEKMQNIDKDNQERKAMKGELGIVMEAQQEQELTPPGSPSNLKQGQIGKIAKGKRFSINWDNLKQVIANAADEEREKQT